ncbi:MAG: ACP S-malonyltransferase [Defluviitaleaceae bacterium]|nr:ACP S-malonyltransferase [Defluviitaleaceae bacterium]
MPKIAFLFPGQGAQAVGMGKEIYAHFNVAQTFFDAADQALDFDLNELVFNGPIETLSETAYTQPALVAVEVMLLKVLEEKGIKPDVLCGLSLGEYSALVAGGALDGIDAVKLVRARGQIMEAALPAGTTSMAAVLGMEVDTLQALLDLADGVVEIANYNTAKQLVIGGEKSAVLDATRLIKDAGIRKVIPLKTSGAFHTSLLKEAGQQLKTVLEKVEFKELVTPVVFNATAAYQDRPLVELMTAQISSPVLFEMSVKKMLADGVDTFIEVGPGAVLSGFLKRIDRQATVHHIHDLQSLEAVLKELV